MGKMLGTYKRILLLSMALSIGVCAVIGYIAIEHNPMGQYCNPISTVECEIVWINILPLLFIWFLVVAVPAILILSCIKYILSRRAVANN